MLVDNPGTGGMNMGLNTRRKAIILHAQDMMRLAGYDKLVLELDERPSKYLIRIYTRGKAHPCDSCVYVHDKDMELATFADTVWTGLKEELL